MKVLDRVLSETLDSVYRDASNILSSKGKSVVFKYTSEHPNPLFHTVRGVEETDKTKPTIKNIYLNEKLANQGFELVVAHELCHIIADEKGFGWKYAINCKLPVGQQNLFEDIAVNINNCFTHVPVYKFMQDYGYDIRGLDSYVINEMKNYVSQGRRWGSAMVASHAIMHIGILYQEEYLVPTLDLCEFERVCRESDNGVLELSDKVQSHILEVNILSAEECYSGVLALRNAIGQELGGDIRSFLYFANPQTGIFE